MAQLLDGGHTRIAGRLTNAVRNIGQDRITDDIVATMRAASYDVRETDPFTSTLGVSEAGQVGSLHVHRIQLKWAKMRDIVTAVLPPSQSMINDIEAYLATMDEVFITDAYHSLSIEG